MLVTIFASRCEVLAGAENALVENILILPYKKAPCDYVSEPI